MQNLHKHDSTNNAQGHKKEQPWKLIFSTLNYFYNPKNMLYEYIDTIKFIDKVLTILIIYIFLQLTLKRFTHLYTQTGKITSFLVFFSLPQYSYLTIAFCSYLYSHKSNFMSVRVLSAEKHHKEH